MVFLDVCFTLIPLSERLKAWCTSPFAAQVWTRDRRCAEGMERRTHLLPPYLQIYTQFWCLHFHATSTTSQRCPKARPCLVISLRHLLQIHKNLWTNKNIMSFCSGECCKGGPAVPCPFLCTAYVVRCGGRPGNAQAKSPLPPTAPQSCHNYEKLKADPQCLLHGSAWWCHNS